MSSGVRLFWNSAVLLICLYMADSSRFISWYFWSVTEVSSFSKELKLILVIETLINSKVAKKYKCVWRMMALNFVCEGRKKVNK